ncbi:hypothetical protein ACFVU3_31945 [Streptomyces sp. NPDC058052]|uniref:hypothetical protein n=1 Tax=Streptomyces sp. NPDC058052 TaxID=3346316 RepID=UPI0036E64F8E
MPTLSDLVTRFPLVPRPRPACSPLPQRVRALAGLAQTARDSSNSSAASAVYNQAALLASDVGLPGLAREWCQQHAEIYMGAAPFPAPTAIHALEPVINLARLRIRAGDPQDGLERLLHLVQAVSDGNPATFDGVRVPADLTHSPADRKKVRDWLWRVLLADGSRTLTSAGRWVEAHTHVRMWKGVGRRMLDGRQIAIVAALTSDSTDEAARLIADTAPRDPWEHAVTACLAALRRLACAELDTAQTNKLTDTVLAILSEHGQVVFQTRLGLTAMKLLPAADTATARRITDRIHSRILDADDGFAAREALADPMFHHLVGPVQRTELRVLVSASGLRTGLLPSPLHSDLNAAMELSTGVLRNALGAKDV